MSRKYKEFADWYNEPIEGLTSVRSDYLMGLESDYRAAWDAARIIDDGPITLEWFQRVTGACERDCEVLGRSKGPKDEYRYRMELVGSHVHVCKWDEYFESWETLAISTSRHQFVCLCVGLGIDLKGVGNAN